MIKPKIPRVLTKCRRFHTFRWPFVRFVGSRLESNTSRLSKQFFDCQMGRTDIGVAITPRERSNVVRVDARLFVWGNAASFWGKNVRWLRLVGGSEFVWTKRVARQSSKEEEGSSWLKDASGWLGTSTTARVDHPLITTSCGVSESAKKPSQP